MSDILNYADIVSQTAEHSGQTKVLTNKVLTMFINNLHNALGDGTSVRIANLGRFLIKDRKARDGINPSNKERLHFKATQYISFKPTRELREKTKAIGEKVMAERANG